MANFPTIIRTRPVGTYELSVPGQRRQFFDVWVDLEEVVHQAFILAKRLAEIDDLTIVPVLTGAGVFNTILGQKLNRLYPSKPVIEVPVVARSYGSSTMSESLSIFADWVLPTLIDGHNILILDDIYDTGRTANDVTEYIANRYHPLSIRRAFVIRKEQSQMPPETEDVFLFQLPGLHCESHKPLFFAGMGMDWKFGYRNLDRIIDINNPRDEKLRSD